MQVDTTGMSSQCNGCEFIHVQVHNHVQVKSLHWIFYLPFLSSYILANPYLMMSLNLGGVVRVVPAGTKHATILNTLASYTLTNGCCSKKHLR